jgi:hypothetical protein
MLDQQHIGKLNTIGLIRFHESSLPVKAQDNSQSSVSSTYLAVEGGGDQGGHDDHGDNDLDGGGDGRSHVECVVCFLLINAREMKSRIMSC